MTSDSPLTNSKGLSVKCPSKNVSPCYGMHQADAEGGCSCHIQVKLSLIPLQS